MVALLSLSSWRIVMVVWLFLAVPCMCLRFVIVVFPDHTHLIFSALSCAKVFFSSKLFIFFSIAQHLVERCLTILNTSHMADMFAFGCYMYLTMFLAQLFSDRRVSDSHGVTMRLSVLRSPIFGW